MSSLTPYDHERFIQTLCGRYLFRRYCTFLGQKAAIVTIALLVGIDDIFVHLISEYWTVQAEGRECEKLRLTRKRWCSIHLAPSKPMAGAYREYPLYPMTTSAVR